jgi:outer membrane protein assembly factor BamB
MSSLRYRCRESSKTTESTESPFEVRRLQRRRWCKILFSVFLLSCVNAGDATAQNAGADWSSFRGNAQSTGFTVAETGDALVSAWKFKLEDGGFESAAAIVANQVTTAGAQEKTVYIAGLTNDVKGKLFALNLSDGTQRWEFNSEDGFLTTPVVADGRLYLGDMAGLFFCIDADGKKQWTYETEIEINSSANTYQDLVLFGSQDGALYALDKATGDFKWKHTTDDQIQCSITVANQHVFLAGCDSMLHVIDVDTGKETGKVKLSSPTISTPAARGDTVFFGNENGTFYSVDAATLKTNWTVTDPRGGNSIRSSAAVAGGHVVVGARNRKLYSFDPDTGKENWSTTLKNKVDSSPVIVKNRVIAASTDGRLYLLNLADGELLWQKQFNGGFTGSPAFAHDHLIVATDDGTVYALKFANPKGNP